VSWLLRSRELNDEINGRSNKGMHATARSAAFINLAWAARDAQRYAASN
jgi:hypothetical protein